MPAWKGQLQPIHMLHRNLPLYKYIVGGNGADAEARRSRLGVFASESDVIVASHLALRIFRDRLRQMRVRDNMCDSFRAHRARVSTRRVFFFAHKLQLMTWLVHFAFRVLTSLLRLTSSINSDNEEHPFPPYSGFCHSIICLCPAAPTCITKSTQKSVS